MRMSDWSSDVCSADLKAGRVAPVIEAHREQRAGTGGGKDHPVPQVGAEQLGKAARRDPLREGGEIEGREEQRRLADQQEREGFCKIILRESEKHPPLAQMRPADDLGDHIIMKVPYASRSEEHTSELQSLMRNSYAVFC